MITCHNISRCASIPGTKAKIAIVFDVADGLVVGVAAKIQIFICI